MVITYNHPDPEQATIRTVTGNASNGIPEWGQEQ
jgi:hypothetical protein